MLKKIRITAAVICFAMITLLFLDFTGSLHCYFGWIAKVQFIPALLEFNAAVVLFLVLLTLIMGRIYCSVICPLGILQDFVSWISGKRKKNRFSYSPALPYLRYIVLALFILAFVTGLSSLFALLEPYSAYGRIASNLFAPIYQFANNLLAYLAAKLNSYTFYSVDIWLKGGITFATALLTLLVVFILAWHSGRTYCNTVCPVGTKLGFISKYSFYRPIIDEDKCNSCGLCARNCKASCIDSKMHNIDYSRCVTCMNCIYECRRDAIKYQSRLKAEKKKKKSKSDLASAHDERIAAAIDSTAYVALGADEDLPSPDLLTPPPPRNVDLGNRELDAMGVKLMDALRTFKVEGELVGRTTGPVVL
jgi:polyferredoxin